MEPRLALVPEPNRAKAPWEDLASNHPTQAHPSPYPNFLAGGLPPGPDFV